jgi:hypothetical protein
LNPNTNSAPYPRTYRTRGWLKVVYKTFGVMMVAMQVTLLWIVYVANFEDRAAVASPI